MSFLCCSEAERERKGRERWGLDERRQHVHQRATYRTLDSQHAALFLPSSFLSPFSLCFFFIYSFIFYFFVHFLLFCLILSPAVLPPFVPALHTEDDTSNFEEPEQAAPRPGTAAHQGALPVGFQGQDLPFLGWFFSRPLATLAKAE